MAKPKLEIADIFRDHGPAWRQANKGHVSLSQLKVMSSIEACRTEALGGHVAACTKCSHQHIAYNSCKNRHCPKCQGPAARDWMTARAEDLLPVEYFHVVFTLPAEIARIAYWNKRAVYGLLFRASAQTVSTIAADPKRLGARVGMTSVLHTWGSALTHHPHVHMIVPGGGLSKDGNRWIACKPGFFLNVRVLFRLFRRLFIEGLLALHHAGELTFFGDLVGLSDPQAFAAYLAPLRKIEWVVYAKPPFGGPEAVLVYLSRYTHRVAISNSRLINADANTVAFKWKDYRIKSDDRQSVMRLYTAEFIRRFLIHVLPDRFHRIRHYGLLASSKRKVNIAKVRTLLGVQPPKLEDRPASKNLKRGPLSLRLHQGRLLSYGPMSQDLGTPMCGASFLETFQLSCQAKILIQKIWFSLRDFSHGTWIGWQSKQCVINLIIHPIHSSGKIVSIVDILRQYVLLYFLQ